VRVRCANDWAAAREEFAGSGERLARRWPPRNRGRKCGANGRGGRARVTARPRPRRSRHFHPIPGAERSRHGSMQAMVKLAGGRKDLADPRLWGGDRPEGFHGKHGGANQAALADSTEICPDTTAQVSECAQRAEWLKSRSAGAAQPATEERSGGSSPARKGQRHKTDV